MGKIRIVKGKFDETCTISRNLTANQVKFPAIERVIQYAEPRMLSTLIVSGLGQTNKAIGKIKTRIGKIPSDRLIGDAGYRYMVQGRLQQASVILEQVGSSGTDGSFSLRLKDNYLTEGMIALFHSELQARVMSQPTGSEGNFVYQFKTLDGTQFDFSVDVAPQSGEKTCFGSYSAFPEKSETGHSRGHFPDWFINHLTIQRKTVGISGSALTDVLWMAFNDTKGWYFKKERDARYQFMMEDEVHKWFSRSTMKDSSGNLLSRSRIIDPSTGNDVIVGDGIIPQIEGVNELDGSGTNGEATIDDINDMMTTLEKRSNAVEGKVWYLVTGTDGFRNFQDLMENKASNTFNITLNKDGSTAAGGPEVAIGYNFKTYNYAGNQLILVKHPLFDDESRFTKRGSDGKILQSSQMVFLDLSPIDGVPNIEILGKGAYGINRTMNSFYLNGATGINMGNLVTGRDALEFHMIKEDGIFVYNTRSCGIINKAA